MGLFVRDETYDETHRMTGFQRYKQLLSFYAWHWIKLGFITFLCAIPLMLGIAYAILSTSVVMALALGLVGGAILGPFIGALVDNIYRAMRDDPGLRWDNYKKGLRQNAKDSILPGAILGLFISIYAFILYLAIYTDSVIMTKGTAALLIAAFFIFTVFSNLFWPQLVLFRQPITQTVRNILLFTAKYFWKVLKVSLLELLFVGFHVIFAPYTMILLPFLSIWYYIFFSQFQLYDSLNEELKIEEKSNLQ
ncbi:MAG: hypothetical protein E7282_11065 [Lachnospiraceae bacterium]|nr:hypothetical protein [Lachnospiraceae bacterium]